MGAQEYHVATHYSDTVAARRRNRRRTLAILLAAAAVATVGAGAMSLALFTDTQAATASWTAGTIKLGSISPSTVFTATDILPGDSGSQTVVVSNTGTGELRYSMTSLATSTDSKGLATQMTMIVKDGACPSTGTTLYTGTLAGASFGSIAQGQNLNDQVLGAGLSQSLCFSWSFPILSGNSYQGANAATTFTFDAEQTAHN
jgi:hypothetical protein